MSERGTREPSELAVELAWMAQSLIAQPGKMRAESLREAAWAIEEKLDQSGRYVKVEVLEQAIATLDGAEMWHYGDKWRLDPAKREAWEAHRDKLNSAKAALRAAVQGEGAER